MDSRLADMVRGVAGAPDSLRLVRGVRVGLAHYPVGTPIERWGDYHYIGNLRVSMAFLIYLARQNALEIVEEVQHAA